MLLPWLASAGSGLLLGLCYPRWDQGWLCWIGLTPLIAAVWFPSTPSGRPILRAALLGYLSGIVFFSFTFRWLSSLAVIFQEEWLRIIPFLLSLYLGLYFAAWTASIAFLIRDRKFLGTATNIWFAIAGSASWVVLEWIRGWLFSGFGWNQLGVALHHNPALIQIAEFTGIPGLSFVIVYCNLTAVMTAKSLYEEIRRKRLRAHLDFTLAMMLVCFVFGYGVFILLHQPSAKGGSFLVEAVQPNIAQLEKAGPDSGDMFRSRYSVLSRVALQQHPQLLVWPEASMPGGIFSGKEAESFAKSINAGTETGFLFGSEDMDLDGNSYNAALLLSPTSNSIQIYHKIHLVPFGEYLPLRKTFPIFAWFAGGLVPADYAEGKEPVVFQMDHQPVLGPLICFEDTVADLTRKFALKGADLFVNITDDAWFLNSEGAYQHLANARFRTVENRRPMIRVANTGITCAINSNGIITQTLAPFKQGLLSARFSNSPVQTVTFYSKHGDLFVHCCIVLLLICLGFRLVPTQPVLRDSLS